MMGKGMGWLHPYPNPAGAIPNITRDAAHLLFLVDANTVALNMPVHVLMQGHDD